MAYWTEEQVEARARDILREWLANPTIVSDWLDEQTPPAMFNCSVPVDATWLFPLDGNDAKLLEQQPTWVLRGLVWAGTDKQVLASALLLRQRFAEAHEDEARVQAEEQLRHEARTREAAANARTWARWGGVPA